MHTGTNIVKGQTSLSIFSGEGIIDIPACDGSQRLGYGNTWYTRKFFASYKENSPYDWWGIDSPGVKTKEISVNVYDMLYEMSFGEALGSLGRTPESLCLTQHQIKAFCEKHTNLLNGRMTSFLFKVKNEIFVADILSSHTGIHVSVDRYGRLRVCHFDDRIRRIITS